MINSELPDVRLSSSAVIDFSKGDVTISPCSDPMIEVPANWLESLASKASKAGDDIDAWHDGEKKTIPVSVVILAGYASSARTFLRLKKPKTK